MIFFSYPSTFVCQANHKATSPPVGQAMSSLMSIQYQVCPWRVISVTQPSPWSLGIRTHQQTRLKGLKSISSERGQ